MKQKSYGGLLVVFFVCILAIGCGAIAGMLHIGEEFSEELIPISISTPIDKISTIDEQGFVANNITVKYATQTLTKNTTKNYTYNKTYHNSSKNDSKSDDDKKKNTST